MVQIEVEGVALLFPRSKRLLSWYPSWGELKQRQSLKHPLKPSLTVSLACLSFVTNCLANPMVSVQQLDDLLLYFWVVFIPRNLYKWQNVPALPHTPGLFQWQGANLECVIVLALPHGRDKEEKSSWLSKRSSDQSHAETFAQNRFWQRHTCPTWESEFGKNWDNGSRKDTCVQNVWFINHNAGKGLHPGVSRTLSVKVKSIAFKKKSTLIPLGVCTGVNLSACAWAKNSGWLTMQR